MGGEGCCGHTPRPWPHSTASACNPETHRQLPGAALMRTKRTDSRRAALSCCTARVGSGSGPAASVPKMKEETVAADVMGVVTIEPLYRSC